MHARRFAIAIGISAAMSAGSFGCAGDGTPAAAPAAGSGGAPAASASGAGSVAQAGASGVQAGSPGVQAGSSGAQAGSAGAVAGASGTPGAAGAAGGTPVPNGTTLNAKIIAKAVPPEGQEHVCVVVELSNETPVWVNRVTASLSGGSHHLIVDRQPATAALYSDPKTCMPTMASDASRLIIAQQKLTTVQLPSGAAFKLEAHQRVFLQLHYFNVDKEAHDVSGSVDFSVVDASAATPSEAKNIFTGSTQISLAAHSAGEVTAFYIPQSPNGKRRFFAVTSHTHRLGTDATIERVASASAPATTPLHESKTWSEPPLTLLDPPISFEKGEGLRLTCRYFNGSDAAVGFGVEAEDEMCFMWLYYYDAP
jgi:hypothetical protein